MVKIDPGSTARFCVWFIASLVFLRTWSGIRGTISQRTFVIVRDRVETNWYSQRSGNFWTSISDQYSSFMWFSKEFFLHCMIIRVANQALNWVDVQFFSRHRMSTWLSCSAYPTVKNCWTNMDIHYPETCCAYASRGFTQSTLRYSFPSN